MEILLVEPAKAARIFGGEDVSLFEPLALEYLGAAVKRDHDVKILDLRHPRKRTSYRWTLSVNAMRQKVDGLMDITAREAGSFYTPGRKTVVPPGTGGAQDITDWDDTTLTSVVAQLDYFVRMI